jgi:glycosyltransferase-like protein
MLTYTTRPRGGAVHAVRVAEELHRAGVPVHLFTLGDPAAGFFRRVEAPHTIWPAPPREGSLEDRVFASIDALTAGLATVAPDFEVAHAQDCISVRAALAARDLGAGWSVARTVHHVDDFTTPALIECQVRSIVDPDVVFVVSRHWRDLLRSDYGVTAEIVPSGVDAERFRRPAGFDAEAFRDRIGVGKRFLFLTVGGIEPRKGAIELIHALGILAESEAEPPAVAVVGGHSFQDHAEYRARAMEQIEERGLTLGVDVLLPGTVDDAELPSWYWSADAFVFPSVNEGWGLALAEALAAGLPTVASNLPVFREFLTDREAVLVPSVDPEALAFAMRAVMADPELRAILAKRGPELVRRHTWARSARVHERLYRSLLRS